MAEVCPKTLVKPLLLCGGLLLAVPLLAVPLPAQEDGCREMVTQACLIADIRAYAEGDIDPFSRDRMRLALARAELAGGDAAAALATGATIESPSVRADFVLAHANHLLEAGDPAGALARLREADALVAESAGGFGRLDAPGQSLRIARAMAEAGAREEAEAVLDALVAAGLGAGINPLVAGLLVEVAEARIDLGREAEAAELLEEVFWGAAEANVGMDPEVTERLFAAWTRAAETDFPRALALKVLEETRRGESVFFFVAMWTGLASGLEARGKSGAAALETAVAALPQVPASAVRASMEARIARQLEAMGRGGEALAVLQEAREAAGGSGEPFERIPGLLTVAEAMIDIGAPEAARALLDDLRAEIEAGEAEGPAGFLALGLPAQLARLGAVDDALAFAEEHAAGSGEFMLVQAADKLILAGEHAQALRVLDAMEGELAMQLRAGLAERMGPDDTFPR